MLFFIRWILFQLGKTIRRCRRCCNLVSLLILVNWFIVVGEYLFPIFDPSGFLNELFAATIIRWLEFILNCQIYDSAFFTDKLPGWDHLDLLPSTLSCSGHALSPTKGFIKLSLRDGHDSWLFLELNRAFVQVTRNGRLLNDDVSITWRSERWVPTPITSDIQPAIHIFALFKSSYRNRHTSYLI